MAEARTESASSEIYGVPWHKVRLEELLRLMEIHTANGQKRLQDFRERRAAVKERQEFLQKRRVARLKMEGIVIDLEAVKRRCKAPKESLWYEDVDEEEKQKLMKKRLKEMFKTQHCVKRIMEEMSDSSSDESTDGAKADGAVPEKPRGGTLLRNYSKIYNTGQDKGKAKEADKGTGKEKEAKPVEEDHKVEEEKADTAAKLESISETDKKPASSKFRKAAVKVTSINRIGGEGGLSQAVGVSGLSTKRNTSASRSKSPNLPRITSGGSRK